MLTWVVVHFIALATALYAAPVSAVANAERCGACQTVAVRTLPLICATRDLRCYLITIPEACLNACLADAACSRDADVELLGRVTLSQVCNTLQDAFLDRLSKEGVRNHLDMQNRLDKDGNRYGKVIDYRCASVGVGAKCRIVRALRTVAHSWVARACARRPFSRTCSLRQWHNPHRLHVRLHGVCLMHCTCTRRKCVCALPKQPRVCRVSELRVTELLDDLCEDMSKYSWALQLPAPKGSLPGSTTYAWHRTSRLDKTMPTELKAPDGEMKLRRRELKHYCYSLVETHEDALTAYLSSNAEHHQGAHTPWRSFERLQISNMASRFDHSLAPAVFVVGRFVPESELAPRGGARQSVQMARCDHRASLHGRLPSRGRAICGCPRESP